MRAKRILKVSTPKEPERAPRKRFPFLDSTDNAKKRKGKKGKLIESACFKCGAPTDGEVGKSVLCSDCRHLVFIGGFRNY
jgi:hypothetical protein